MNHDLLLDAISELDADLIEKYWKIKEKERQNRENKRKSAWLQYVAIAAAICAVGVLIFAIASISRPDQETGFTLPVGSDEILWLPEGEMSQGETVVWNGLNVSASLNTMLQTADPAAYIAMTVRDQAEPTPGENGTRAMYESFKSQGYSVTYPKSTLYLFIRSGEFARLNVENRERYLFSLASKSAYERDTSIVEPGSSGIFNPSAEHGEKKVYGYAYGAYGYERRESVNSWGDFYFQVEAGVFLECFDRTGQTETFVVCFDPLCDHSDQDCPASYNFDTYKDGNLAHSSSRYYPYYVFADFYDNAESPVFYSVYRRNDIAQIGNELVSQEPYYLIERYDLSAGGQVTIRSGIRDLVHAAYTYGDCLYYVTSEDYITSKSGDSEGAVYTLNAMSKSGADIGVLTDENTRSLEILDITDDGLYYRVNSRYIYRCSLTLENPELLLDIDSVTDGNGNHVQLAALRGEYIFYYGDLEVCEGMMDPDGLDPDIWYHANCYRAPIADPLNSVKIAEKMIIYPDYHVFTDNYLYYMPCVMEQLEGDRPYWEDDRLNYFSNENYSDGVVKAVNLFTGETVTACELPGLSFWVGSTDGDNVLISGWAYDERGLELKEKRLRIHPDGSEWEIWNKRVLYS